MEGANWCSWTCASPTNGTSRISTAPGSFRWAGLLPIGWRLDGHAELVMQCHKGSRWNWRALDTRRGLRQGAGRDVVGGGWSGE